MFHHKIYMYSATEKYLATICGRIQPCKYISNQKELTVEIVLKERPTPHVRDNMPSNQIENQRA